MDTGVLYLAIGEQHRAEAVKSAETVREYNPGLPIALVTNSGNVEPGIFSAIALMDSEKYTGAEKARALSTFPFECTLFLDTDTIVLGPLGAVFDTLNRFDVFCVPDVHCGHSDAPPTLPAPNSGVIAIRQNDATEALFPLWFEWIERFNRGDQAALRVALWKSKVNICFGPNTYNLRCDYPALITGRAVILHGRHRIEQARHEINKFTELRFWNPRAGEIVRWQTIQ